MNFYSNFTSYIFPKLGYIKVPKFKIPSEDLIKFNLNSNSSSQEYLLCLADDGYNRKLKSGIIPQNKAKIYWDRILFELSEINKLLFTDYILLVYNIIRFCDNNGILNSPSRGSCGGSLLLYAIGVVKIDAIKHELLFERFVASGRTEIKEINGEKYIKSENLPDIDIDSDRELKYKINNFIQEQFPNRTCSIKTVNTLQGKSVIKEVLKCYEDFNEEDAKYVSDIIETKFGKVEQISDALVNNDKFKKWAQDHKESVELSEKINTLYKNFSVHASGIALCEEQLDDNIPIELSSTREPVSCYDMDSCQMYSIKLDNLGLKNLTSIKLCLDLIGKKLEDIDINDESIYTFLRLSENYRGIFQAEDGLGKSVMRKLQCNNIEDITMSIAIGRPGSMKFLDEILEARNEGLNKEIDIRVKDILSSTYSVIIYQEQIMALSRRMANFTPQEADGLRKGIGKKIKEKILLYKDRFIDASIKNGYEPEFVKEMWDTFVASGDYLFNKSHSCGYAYLSGICSYLKSNYPTEFFYSLLVNSKNESKPLEEICNISSELPKFGVNLLKPHLIKSGIDFKIEDKNNIRIGIGNIKGVAEKSLVKLKNFCHQYSNKFEIFSGAEQSGLPIGILNALIYAGCLDDYLTESRSKTVLESSAYNILTDREKERVLEFGPKFNFNLIEVIRYLSKPQEGSIKSFLKESRLETIREKFRPYNEIYKQNIKNEELCGYILEKALIGFSYSYRLFDIIKKTYADIITINEAKGELDDNKVMVCGEVTEVRSGKSKKGNKYVKFSFTDSTGEFSALLMEKNFEGNNEANNDKKIEEGDIVVIKGTKKGDIIFCDKIVNQNVLVALKYSQLKNKD